MKVKDSAGTETKKYFDVTVTSSKPLTNTSKVSAESIKLGNSFTATGSATGGKSPYQYAFYYKQTSQSKWTIKQDFNSNTSVSIKPSNATTYDVCIKVKDSAGTIEKKYFTVKVTNDKLNIDASISHVSASLGKTVTVDCSATGGTTPYQYAFYYKNSTVSSWTTVQNFSSKSSASFKPSAKGNYDVCAKVKDGSGTIAKVYFELTIK